jgi:hypothetical protein
MREFQRGKSGMSRPGLARIALTLLAACGGVAGVNAASITDFSMYAQGNVFVGGTTTVGTSSQPALVGAGASVCVLTGTTSNTCDATVAGGAGIHGDLRAGDDVTLNNGSFVTGTITNAGTFTAAASATYGAHVTAQPDMPTLPGATSFSAGATSPPPVGNGGTLSLAPGSYLNITLGGAATLNLTAGDYYLNSLTAGNGLTINVVLGGGDINLYIVRSFSAGGIQAMNLTGGTWENVYAEAHGTGLTGSALNNVFRIGGGSGTNWKGTVFTTNGDIHLGSGSSSGTIEGYLWSARNIDLEHGLDVIPPDVVPVPAAVWLMGSALGLLGGVRRRSVRAANQ